MTAPQINGSRGRVEHGVRGGVESVLNCLYNRREIGGEKNVWKASDRAEDIYRQIYKHVGRHMRRRRSGEEKKSKKERYIEREREIHRERERVSERERE